MRKMPAVLTVAVAWMVGGSITPVAASSPAPAGATVVQTALKYVGLPYTKTGTIPDTGFSDLGFVRYVYGQNGISLHIGITRAAYRRLLSRGPYVAMAELQPGDIIIFKNTVTSGLSHVGIYVGSGQMINAARPGTVVRLDAVGAMSGYAGGARLL